MSTVGEKERATQARVIGVFRDQLGYEYLGRWQDLDVNSNVEEDLVIWHLEVAGYSAAHIERALHQLRTAKDSAGQTLYERNRAVHELLRYGAKVKVTPASPTEDVHFINWAEPEKNHFGVAEEVTLVGENTRRPDLVLYVNGIALGVIELKQGGARIGDAIRQSISNQRPEFNAWFYSTVQYLFAGNDTQGLKYATVGTPEKYWLTWKEDEADNAELKLDKYLRKMCDKRRFLELIHDFVLFDGGIKKVPRVHQYFGVKAAQEHIARGEGGIIWHTQGSGKSLVMVLLARWILERLPNARVAIITDRTELDEQIEAVFAGTGDQLQRADSGRDLIAKLGEAKARLIGSLVHKFGTGGKGDFDAYLKGLREEPVAVVGDLFVFVDECHRTQSGKLHRAMKAMLPTAVFIGFTGTPLLKEDRATTYEVFGGYIHTYRFGEAVADNVILDLVYEARDIQQRLGATNEIDGWFDSNTQGLSDYQKAMLKDHWATMQKVLSSRNRMDRIVANILYDFTTRPRLRSQRGTAMLVASSIYEACRYFELFQKTKLKGKCAVITSYDPQAGDVSKEDTGANTESDKQVIYNTYVELLKDVVALPKMTKTETYELRAKQLFKSEPANMKLLIVVDKLLTGFDAPSCTFLYLDKSMQDHGLFQAICRTNRLDTDDKDFGYIVDYKDLFKEVENAIEVYTGELDPGDDGVEPQIQLEDRLKRGKERLDAALEAVALLCEPVPPPKGKLEYQRHFCGNVEVPSELSARRGLRDALYQGVAQLARAYANLELELQAAGYTAAEADKIRATVKHYVALRDEIRLAADETLDLKPYEADMRFLIDTYIEADAPRKISPFEGLPLLELISKLGIARAMEAVQERTGGDAVSASDVITRNVRSRIIKGSLTDPAYFQKMSDILDELIRDLRDKRIDYKKYLERLAELAKKVQAGQDDGTPASLDTPGKRVLYHNLGRRESVVLDVHEAVLASRFDGWRDNRPREMAIKRALFEVLEDTAEVDRVFELVKKQPEY